MFTISATTKIIFLKCPIRVFSFITIIIAQPTWDNFENLFMRQIFSVALLIMVAACTPSPKRAKATGNVSKKAKTLMFPEAKVNIKTVGILLYDNYAILDAMGPYHVLSELMDTKVFFVGRRRGLITTGEGMKVQCDTSINDVKQLDILVIPGGLNATYAETRDSVLINWIKAINAHSKYTTSVCTGAWILAATGLLKDHQATTHWYGKKILKDKFGIEAQDKRFVRSGKYWTSAGVSAGIDMSLALVNEIRGENYTKAVMLDLEYDPQPPYNAGSEQKTEKQIVDVMRSIYDSAMAPAILPKKKTEPVSQSVSK